MIVKGFVFSYLKIALKVKNWKEVSKVKKQISDLLDKDTFGYVIRSRFKNNASEEVTSLYHAGQEMKNVKKNSINKLKINGIIEDDDKVIEFFNALFNGHHNSNLEDTSSSFQPDYSGIDAYLA